jgi:hypothetical protein
VLANWIDALRPGGRLLVPLTVRMPNYNPAGFGQMLLVTRCAYGYAARFVSPVGIVEAVRTLARICSDDLLANALNRSGLLTGRGNRWTRERVTALRTHHDIPCYDRDRRDSEGWMNLTEASHFLGISARTLRLAVDRGEIEAEHPLTEGPWVLNRRNLETEAVTAFVARVQCRNRVVAIPSSQQGTLGFSRISTT